MFTYLNKEMEDNVLSKHDFCLFELVCVMIIMINEYVHTAMQSQMYRYV